jgi:hypothetical protein
MSEIDSFLAAIAILGSNLIIRVHCEVEGGLKGNTCGYQFIGLFV